MNNEVRNSQVNLDDCGCPPSGSSRRTVLKAGALAAGAVAATGLHTQLAFAAGPYSGDTLVVLSLRGGFDGLSAIAPIGDPNYRKLRPALAIPASKATKLTSTFGLAPALAPLAPYWKAGHFTAIHAVGTMDRTRSHFEAMNELERAAPGSTLRTGWLDRTLGLRTLTTPFQAVQVGGNPSPGFNGPFNELSMNSIKSATLNSDWNDTYSARWHAAIPQLYAGIASPLATPINTALSAATTTQRLTASGYTSAATYPANSHLGAALADLAHLIKADVGLQIAAVDFGDWDFHENLGNRMSTHLSELGTCLAAFAQDLGSALGRVTVITLSEFGRRAAENGNHGADHGHGNVMMVLGAGAAGGKIHGKWPTLAASKLDRGDLAGTTDYRSVLAEALRYRCGATSTDIATVFPGFRPAAVGAFKRR